jgi:hypothetical protein
LLGIADLQLYHALWPAQRHRLCGAGDAGTFSDDSRSGLGEGASAKRGRGERCDKKISFHD